MTLGVLVEVTAASILDEVVIVVAGAPAAPADPRTSAQEALELADGGMRLKAAAAQVAERVDLRPNQVYRAVFSLRDRQD